MYDEIFKALQNKVKELNLNIQFNEQLKEQVNNPMESKPVEELFNAIFCYDENENICGYAIQLRTEEAEAYKYVFYLPLVGDSWNRKTIEQIPDKQVKIGYYGNYVSEKQLLSSQSIELAAALALRLNFPGVIYLGKGFVGIKDFNTLKFITLNCKYAGYPVNDIQRERDKQKLFV